MVRPRLHRSHPGSPRILQRLQTAGGFHLPDYHGGSIVNLLSSITHAMGGASPHPGLKALEPRLFEGISRIVYLVLDGVGYNQLARFMAAGGGGDFFSRHPCQRITHGFPHHHGRGSDDVFYRRDPCGARCAELASAPP